MNRHDNTVPPFDAAASEREWQAQEQAMRRELPHLDAMPDAMPDDAAGDAALVRRYQLLARALRQPLEHQLPVDFAAQVAAHSASHHATHHASQAVAPASAPSSARRPGTRLESGLMIALAGVFAVAAGVVSVLYGSSWLPAMRSVMPPRDPAAMQWLLAFAGCLALAWLLGRWPPHGRPRPQT